MKWVQGSKLSAICTKNNHLCWQLASAVVPKKHRPGLVYSIKYDGIRIEVRNGKLLSRKGFILPTQLLPAWAKKCHYILDGELVLKSHSTHTKVIKALHNIDYKSLKLMVFDVKITNLTFAERLELLAECVPDANRVVQVPIEHESDTSDAMDECMKHDYEGIIVRSLQGIYTCGRRDNREMYKMKIKK